MPLQKLQFRPGIAREATSYANEGGWYACDKVRFRLGFAEKIGGWTQAAPQAPAAREVEPYANLLLNPHVPGATPWSGSVTAVVAAETFSGASFWTLAKTLASTSESRLQRNLSFSAGAKGYARAAFLAGTSTVGQFGLFDFTAGTWGVGSAVVVSGPGVVDASGTGLAQVSGLSATEPTVVEIARTYAAGTADAGLVFYPGGSTSTTVGASVKIAAAGVSAAPFAHREAHYLGVARSLWEWTTLSQQTLVGIGTSAKFYLQQGGALFDITPYRKTSAIVANAITTTVGASTVTVNDPAHGASVGAFVAVSAVSGAVGGISAAQLTGTFQITSVALNTFTFVSNGVATSAATGAGATITYALNPGLDFFSFGRGWGTGTWGRGTWGSAAAAGGVGQQLRLWSQVNYGEQLLFAVRGGPAHLWTPSALPGTVDRGVPLTSLPGASSTPLFANIIKVENTARITLLFGTNDVGSTTFDPMVVRWSDAESLTQWSPAITNQAGSFRFSLGNSIVAVAQHRQDLLVLTDTALYSMQYVNVPFVFSTQLHAGNVSVVSPNAVVSANGDTFWMGRDKFYVFTGRLETLACPLWSEVFQDINKEQLFLAHAGTNERFNEIWWFYPSAGSLVADRYVAFNYIEKVWFYGNMNRDAWIDSRLSAGPIASYAGKLVVHETSVDDEYSAVPAPISAFIESADFDIGDGQTLGFVTKVVPDITFDGSSGAAPSATFTVRPRVTPGGAYNKDSFETATRTSAAPVEQFTQFIYVRARGRQMALRVSSDTLGTHWQLGTPRIDVRADGRKSL